ncbi:coiled-coil domain-containing protein 71 [Numida meleagris]|uniref:coiled-coil domain-containing protein 71 n=1 Tax=Numida meleagris TaxID=8996 RepID=UPI000B3E029B|nr:coiled-coil domain-containing protein 71 [Numida meleagris]XP_021265434.1 coiled-coil domain-containing protein 71 [Numida meleagris]XP_021265435.1 coiled-coil domain-containing protein 71 [Numida meleagris]XP_021265436.1 coiled-coil domain-containing protein 71 [Numida meleagris]
MNIAVNNVEEKAVHSWSRIYSAGQKVLEEALRVFNPMSKDLSDTETQLVAFIQGLKEEGFQPTILRSKDVYGYSSCTADTPSQAKGSTPHSCTAATTSSPPKTPARSTAAMARVTASPASVSVNSSKVSSPPASKGNSTNLLLNSFKQTRSGKSKASAVGFPASMYPDVYPAVRLSVVLEALVPLKTPTSCLESKYTRGPLGVSPSDLKLLKVSSQTRQFSSGKTTKIREGKRCKRVVKKAPDSATLALNLLKGLKGGVLQESNACKASGVLNGRITGSSSQGCTTAPQSKVLKIKAKEALVGRVEWKDSSTYQETAGKKRKRVAEARDAPQRKKSKSIPVQNKSRRARSTLNLLKFWAIKVGNSSSDDEVRRRAQKILRVNLSPVIRIQPLSHSHSVP